MDQNRYLSECKEILDLFVITGKEIPHVDSDIGVAVQILQKICDSQSHSVPSFGDRLEELEAELVAMGWKFFHGNAACNPYADHKAAGVHIEADSMTQLRAKVLRQINNIEHEIFLDAEIESSEIFEALEELENHIGEADFTFDFDGNEYRIIRDSDIWEIYRDEIQNLVEECYTDVLKLDQIPAFIAVSIDWEQTAQNAFADGYGHTFSGYDGSEEEAAGYWIFRTN